MRAGKLAIAALFATSLAIAQPSGTAAISGTVVQHGSNEPVRRASVWLYWHGNPPSMALAVTDRGGQFTFDRLPAGRYSMRAARDGVGMGLVGDEGSAGEFIVLEEGERRNGTVIRLRLSGSISGVVTDPDGEPVQGAFVQIQTAAYPRGTRQLIMVSGVTTNHNGEYHATGLNPGTYYVVLDTPGEMLAVDATAEAQVFRRQYYGGTNDWRRATPVVLASGAQLQGIDLQRVVLRAVRVTGRVVGVPAPPAAAQPAADEDTGQPREMLPPVHIAFQGEDAELQHTSQGASATPPEYKFEVPGIAPGRYRLFAKYEAKDGSTLYARRPVEISEESNEIEVALAPPVDLRGTVRYEGDPAARPKQFQVTLVPGEPTMFPQPQPAAVNPDGTYAIAAVPPGIWDINPGPIPRGGYLKSMRLGEQDVLTEEMEIGAQSKQRLDIVISARGGRLEGEVQGETVRKRPAIVMLAPTGKFAAVMSFFAFTESEPDGKFKIAGLTPGRYLLFAFDRIPAGDFRGPDIVERMKMLAEPVEIREGEVTTARPAPIKAEQLKEVLR